MVILYSGLVLFIAIHLVPCVVELRDVLADKLGEKRYKAVFSAISATGLVMIIWGYSKAPLYPVYEPPSWGSSLSFVAVTIALVLFAAANMSTHIRAMLHHPMIMGLLLWAIAHLSANGDQASVVMFGGFALYAVIALISSFARKKRPSVHRPPRLTMDLAAVAGGLVVAALFVKFHGALFGMPLVSG